MATVLLSNPLVQEKIAENALKQAEQHLPKQSLQQYDDDDDDTISKKKKKKKKDDDDDDEEEDDEEDEEEKEARLRRKREKKLAKVNTTIQKLYNIDKENAIKFKKAYYEGKRDDLTDSNIQIDYDTVKAKISKIKVENNKIFSVFIILGSETTEIPRNQIMINGSPVYNRSIIQKIMSKCIDPSKE
jgi:hypothetical protein